MPTSLLLLTGLAVLLVAGIPAGWLLWRRRVPAGAAPAAASADGRNDLSGLLRTGDRTAATPLQRLHAMALEGSGFSHGVVVAGSPHAQVVSRAVATLGRIEAQPRYTPRRPRLLPQLMRMVNDADVSGPSIAAIIGQDPVLAGTLLRIAGSPLYNAQARPVEDIAHAVAMVGTDGIRQLIAVALVQPVMGGQGSGPFRRLAELTWNHTLLSAAAAADHAQLVEREDAFPAQLLGLTHGLGTAAVARVARDQYARVPALAPEAGVVQALLDAWATPTAQRIAAKWELSEPIREALGESPDDAPRTALGRSLRFGQAAGALALLCRDGRIDEAAALRELGSAPDRDDAIAGIWKRLRRGAAAPDA